MFKRALFTVAREADADELAALMRAEDRAEIALLHGLGPREGAKLSLSVSEVAFAARIGGELACCFGAVRDSLLDGSGVAWMLCTDLPRREPRAFAANCREGFRLLSDALPDVTTWTNRVHVGNAAAMRWLGWAGAWFSHDETAGQIGGRFKAFSIDAQDAGKDKRHV